MGLTDYLVSDVSKDEFRELKREEDWLYRRALDTINDAHQERVAKIESRLRYNPKRGMIGIWVGNKLAISPSRLTDDENTLASAVYEEVNNGLNIIRGGLEKEEWVDEINELKQVSLPPETDTSTVAGGGKPEKDDIPF